MTLPSTGAAWRVLVTGGAGFIGSRLVRTIEKTWENARVTIIDDFRSGDFKNLEGFRGDIIAADLTEIDLSGYFTPKQFDAIFHLASITDTRVMDQLQMCQDNIESFRNLLDFAQQNQVPITYASSAATYGIDAKVNVETDPRKPANVYGFSKVQLENLAAKYLEVPDNGGWKINAVRFFNVYGPHEQHKDKMASMIYQLYLQMKAGQNPKVFKSGEQSRDFVHVDDCVDCTLGAMGGMKQGIFNTGSGIAHTFNDVIEILNKELGTSLEADYIENPFKFFQPFTQADLTRSKEELGYEPKHTLETGIKAYVEWLESKR